MRVLKGFSVVEVLLVIAILLILSAMVFPVLADVEQRSRTGAMAATVRDIRDQVVLYSAIGTTAKAPSGFPLTIDRAWFTGGDLPTHAWTSEPMSLEIVDGPAELVYPDVKYYEHDPVYTTTRPTAWYNRANGSFCIRVPRRATESETMALFYRVNDPGAEGTPRTGRHGLPSVGR